MKFVQIIEYTTSRRDDMNKIMDEWLAATEGKRTPTHALITQDRDRPNTYVEIVEFPSYDVAMKNSDFPETKHFAEQAAKICEGMTFRNLDVLREDTL